MGIREIIVQADVVGCCTETSFDYEGWSKEYNMHFGYFTFANIKDFCQRLFNREIELE